MRAGPPEGRRAGFRKKIVAANRKKAANVPFALGALVSIMAFPVARGAEPTDPCDEQPPYKVGCTIRNPATGELEEIYRVPPEGSGVDMGAAAPAAVPWRWAWAAAATAAATARAPAAP
jgi:hypothetical protein